MEWRHFFIHHWIQFQRERERKNGIKNNTEYTISETTHHIVAHCVASEHNGIKCKCANKRASVITIRSRFVPSKQWKKCYMKYVFNIAHFILYSTRSPIRGYFTFSNPLDRVDCTLYAVRFTQSALYAHYLHDLLWYGICWALWSAGPHIFSRAQLLHRPSPKYKSYSSLSNDADGSKKMQQQLEKRKRRRREERQSVGMTNKRAI